MKGTSTTTTTTTTSNSNSNGGVEVADRRWRFRMYRNCFTGSDAVNWILKNVTGIDTREAAAILGQKLMDSNYFRHVVDRKEFIDGYFFYTFQSSPSSYFSLRESLHPSTPSTTPSPTPTTPPSDPSSTVTPVPTLPTLPPTGSGKNEERKIRPSQSTIIGEVSRPILDRWMKLDLAMPSSGNQIEPSKMIPLFPEWIVLKHDSQYDPYFSYNIEINWLATSGSVIDDFIQLISRKAKVFGLQLCGIPAEITMEWDKSTLLQSKELIPIPKSYEESLKDITSSHFAILMQKFEYLAGPIPGFFISKNGAILLTIKGDYFIGIWNTLPSFLPFLSLTKAQWKDFKQFLEDEDALDTLFTGHSKPPLHSLSLHSWTSTTSPSTSSSFTPLSPSSDGTFLPTSSTSLSLSSIDHRGGSPATLSIKAQKRVFLPGNHLSDYYLSVGSKYY